MAEFFLELFSEEIPVSLQKNLRDKLLEEFQKFFLTKSINSKKNFRYNKTWVYKYTRFTFTKMERSSAYSAIYNEW